VNQTALAACQRALALYEELGDRIWQAAVLDSLGLVYHRLGRYAEAGDCYHRALSLYREFGGRHAEADVLHHLGDVHQAKGDVAGASLARTSAASA
jgi:tetratricopeptide (TPR) repeat protein